MYEGESGLDEPPIHLWQCVCGSESLCTREGVPFPGLGQGLSLRPVLSSVPVPYHLHDNKQAHSLPVSRQIFILLPFSTFLLFLFLEKNGNTQHLSKKQVSRLAPEMS